MLFNMYQYLKKKMLFYTVFKYVQLVKKTYKLIIILKNIYNGKN